MESPPAVNPWDWIYATRAITSVGWHEPEPRTSLALIENAVGRGGRTVIDVGGGASSLVDHLLAMAFDRVAVLDIADAGLAIARHRLADRAERVEWIVGDAATIDDVGRFDIWHDRAGFHFLLEAAAQERYLELLRGTVSPGGTAIIATFADDGPGRCSGLPIVRWEPDRLAAAVGSGFRLIDERRHTHYTPAGVAQRFQYSVFTRISAASGDADATRG